MTIERAMELIALQTEKIFNLEEALDSEKKSSDYWYKEAKKNKEEIEKLKSDIFFKADFENLKDENRNLEENTEKLTSKPAVSAVIGA